MKNLRAYTHFGLIFLAGSALFAQTQIRYAGTNATGDVVLARTVSLVQASQPVLAPSFASGDVAKAAQKLGPPPAPARNGSLAATAIPVVQSLPVIPGSGSFSFNGLTHLDQKNANNGNQFNVEPPNPSIAVSNDFILEGVNNAIQVYSKSGTPLLNKVLATNQVFGVSPAIDFSRPCGSCFGGAVNGVFPTDMRVFYDAGINRWFVVQRAQAFDVFGNSLRASQIYIAVSQTGDPTGLYNIYVDDTTDAQRPGCPCLADYPQIGADQYGFYISSNVYALDAIGNPSQSPVNATILAISKASLASGASSPTAYKFVLPPVTGFEFTIQPASAPPTGSNFIASGGLEFFVSSIATGNNVLSVWAVSNTSSLGTANPSLALTRITVPSLSYSVPINALQRPGPLPYGSTLNPPGVEPLIDTSDTRTLSVMYAAGRLYATLGTLLTDENGRFVAGAAYVVLSPTFRGGTLAANILGQGYLLVKNNNFLRPAIGVNPQGKGVIGGTLVGSDYYPSAAFIPFSGFSAGSAVQLVAPGAMPEDGFTGYPNAGFTAQGVARWGDYSTAVVAPDGSIWVIAEYIPNAPRSLKANWGTFLTGYTP